MFHKLMATSIAIGLVLIACSLPAKLFAQEKRATATRSLATVGTKQSTSETRPGAETTQSELQKPSGGETKTRDDELRARGQANDYWTTCFGAFHFFGNSGHAIYRYPARATGTPYDTRWTFEDDLPVGGRQGWTYDEVGFEFYVFVAKSADSNGKWWVGTSTDNQTFRFYAWAD